ncbi:MAG: PQQ-dependent sugar dehydrogenase [Chloroflexi bacterium]|nr:PQQ-dependent sugar dehydrogenase [Chloroflexota bacterium]
MIGRGLLGMAFHPRYDRNGKFYVFYTRKRADPAKHGDIVIAQFKGGTDLTADPSSRRTVLVIDHPSEFHFGGWMGFRPDGYLYVTTGDTGDSSLGHPEDIRTRLAKVLRLDPRDPPGPRTFTVPSDNPFVGVPENDLVWAYGSAIPGGPASIAPRATCGWRTLVRAGTKR